MQRPLLLSGFMATGKSTVAQLVQERTGHPYVDLDARLEERAALSIPEIFRLRGEAAFRELERAELVHLLDNWRRDYDKAPVVALGGGALLLRQTRLDCLERAIVVTLTASVSEIAKRVEQPVDRPLIAGADVAARAAELLEQRRNAYAEAHASIATDGVTPALVAERASLVWARDPIAVAASGRSYCVEINSGGFESRLSDLASGSSALLFVTDRNVAAFHRTRLEAAFSRAEPPSALLELEPGEQHKNIRSLERIWQAAFDHDIDRSSRLIGIGGGVVTDVTGFAAATWMRGVAWLAVPTNLLAMVDAAIGGKTAVDFLTAKNSIGAFWQPKAVLCDVDFLGTESVRNYRSALAEVVKTAIIGDPELFARLSTNLEAVRQRSTDLTLEMVRRSARVKASIVSRDERESGLRALLNFGHTLGHALEAQRDYTRWTHGEAVSLGLVAALRVGVGLGVTPPELADETTRLLSALGLPVDLAAEPLGDVVDLIYHDKKRVGDKLRFVVARELGRVETVTLALADLRRLALQTS